MRGVRQAMHAPQPARRHDGVVRGSVRRLPRVPATGPGADLMTAGLDFENWTCPLPLRDTPAIVMGHGGGGAMSNELVEHLFLPGYGPAAEAGMGDSAVVTVGGSRLAFSTDSFVVKPMFFPGGSI